MDFIIKNIGVLATPEGVSAKSGKDQSQIRVIKNAVVGVAGGKIAYVGDTLVPAKAELDAGGRLVTPGLVDAHTHLIFGGYRQNELPAKLAGVTYLDILKAGGGIHSTVSATRDATVVELYHKAWRILDQMLVHGTTTAEAKSGYGLDKETELKQLSVAAALHKEHSVDLVSTFMGAHAVPHEYRADPMHYVSFLVNDMLGIVARKKLAEFCDIFCEDGAFSIEQSRWILDHAKDYGFGVKIHGDEVTPMGGAALAAELGALSAEHLIEADDAGLAAMAKAGVIAVLLPATSFYLDKSYARARDMVGMGVAVALGSDFNPGSSPNYNMQFVLTLACLKLKLSPAEALTAATLNAAAAIKRSHSKGSIEAGKDADMVIWDCPDLDFLFYRYGNNQVHKVVKNGRLVV